MQSWSGQAETDRERCGQKLSEAAGLQSLLGDCGEFCLQGPGGRQAGRESGGEIRRAQGGPVLSVIFFFPLL